MKIPQVFTLIHKHKIKHDKTTMQSSCLCRGGISTIYVYSHTHKQLQVD